MDVGQDASLSDGNASEEFVQLLVVPEQSSVSGSADQTTPVPDSQLQVPGNYPCLLVVPGSIAGQLEDLGSEVLHGSGQVDRSSGADTLCIVALPEHDQLNK